MQCNIDNVSGCIVGIQWQLV